MTPLRLKKVIDGLRRAVTGGAPASREDSSAKPEDTGLLRAFNVTRGVEIASRVEWAGTSHTRRRGLLGRSGIDPDEGMYIVPTQWIHMFGMRFSIDVAFLGSDGRVLHVHHRLKPNRLSRPVWRAEGALELAAGRLAATDTRIGDVVEFK